MAKLALWHVRITYDFVLSVVPYHCSVVPGERYDDGVARILLPNRGINQKITVSQLNILSPCRREIWATDEYRNTAERLVAHFAAQELQKQADAIAAKLAALHAYGNPGKK